MPKYCRKKPPPLNSALPLSKCSLVIKRRRAAGLASAWRWRWGFVPVNAAIAVIRTVKARPRMSTTPTTETATDRLVEACRECDGTTNLYEREWKEGGVRVDPDERYRCGECGATFGEPIERPARRVVWE